MPWSIVAVAMGAEVLSGAVTATEPAGAAEGDLLVCGVSARGNAAFTLPTGWTIVATAQNSGNLTVNTSGSISSGLLAYIVRGASAPDLVFPRTGGGVSRSACVAYRGVRKLAPYDTGSANTLGTASTTVTTTTITTAEDGELLVALYAGARGTAGSAFDAATGATTGSGAAGADTTTPPASNTWIQRAHDLTTAGEDYGTALADAVMTTAGATGTAQCTAGSSARHVLIVGAFNPGYTGRGLLKSERLTRGSLVA